MRRDRRFEDLSDTPRGQLLALFGTLHEWFSRPDFRGCMFIKAVAEYPDKLHPIHAQSAEHKRLLSRHFNKLANLARAADPGTPARQMLLLKEGAIAAAVMGLCASAATDAKTAARRLLADHRDARH